MKFPNGVYRLTVLSGQTQSKFYFLSVNSCENIKNYNFCHRNEVFTIAYNIYPNYLAFLNSRNRKHLFLKLNN